MTSEKCPLCNAEIQTSNRISQMKYCKNVQCFLWRDLTKHDIERITTQISAIKQQTAKEFIDKIYPLHDRTSCSDDDLGNGLYSNDGYARCARCVMLELLSKELPKSHSFSIQINIDDKIAEKEQKFCGDEK